MELQDASNKEKAGIDNILGQFSPDRSNLLPILRIIQDTNNWISPEAVLEISSFMGISRNDVYSVITFYPVFRLTEPE